MTAAEPFVPGRVQPIRCAQRALSDALSLRSTLTPGALLWLRVSSLVLLLAANGQDPGAFAEISTASGSASGSGREASRRWCEGQP